ncbi:MAG: ABC transporter substrate-binding protein [Lentisphaeria bacterium]|jgi:NitT/TauT family transport system substrate-binding protein
MISARILRWSAAACALAIAVATGIVASKQTAPTRPQPASPFFLRLAIATKLEALPFMVAENAGIFSREGLRVKLVMAGSAEERDRLVASGKADGAVSDPVALLKGASHGTHLVAIRSLLDATPQRPLFRLLAAPDSGLHDLADLRGVPVAVAAGAQSEYVARQTLARGGLPPGDIQLVNVPVTETRLALLRDGRVRAAILPEPQATLAAAFGAIPLADAIDQSGLCCTLLAVRKELFWREPETLRRLVAALDRAAIASNAEKEAWRDLAVSRQLLPRHLDPSFELPDYSPRPLPAPAMLEPMAAWLQQAGHLREKPEYRALFRTP